MSDDDSRPEDPERVRILGADEADEALGRDDVVHRRSPEEPRPGDRPHDPPEDTPEPVLRFPLSSSAGGEQDDLPHWTEPPTGAHQTGGTIFDRDDPGEERDWSAFSAAPRWRDEAGDEWAEDDVRAFGGDDTKVGALDEERPDPEEFFTFDDLDEPSSGRSVFGDAPPAAPEDDDEYDVYDDEDGGASGPRKIVVGGGRVTPGRPQMGAGAATASGAGIGGDRDMNSAVLVGVALLGIAGVLFYLGPAFAAILVVIVVTAAAGEFFTKLREVGYAPANLLGMAATASVVIGTYHRGEAAIPVVLVLTIAFAMLWNLAGAGEGQATLNIGVTLLGVGWIGVFGSFATALLAVQGPGIGDAGKGILFGAILATVGYDVGGYFVGRGAGRSALSAASPNKTVEGLVGGCLAALVVAVIYGFLSEPLGSTGDGVALGLAVAIAAPLGDLCQSMIKRDLGIKDMGAILPGHGGVMDRFDALLFVLPAVYYVAKLQDFFL